MTTFRMPMCAINRHASGGDLKKVFGSLPAARARKAGETRTSWIVENNWISSDVGKVGLMSK